MKEVLFVLLFSGLLYGANGQFFSIGCPDGWVLQSNICYKFVEEALVFEEADAACWATGARLLSVDSFQEHKFVSDFLVTNKFSRQMYYYTSGSYYLGQLFWEGDKQENEDGPTFWINDKSPPIEAKIYRVVYTYTTLGFEWTNVTASVLGSYICEIPRSQAQTIELMNRDFNYGLEETDEYGIRRGPTIVSQPENIIVFEGVNVVDVKCIATGHPNPTYWWYRGKDYENNIAVTSAFDNRYTVTAGKFTIEGPESHKDLDLYHCIAENEIGAVLSNQAKILFGYLGYVSNVEPMALYAKSFKGTKMNCETPSYSPRVNYAWFKNQATNIFVWPGNSNMFVSWSGALYVSEVQPTDANKRYFCLITLMGTDDARLGKGNTLVRTNKGIKMLLLQDTSSDNDYGPILYTHVFPSPTLRGNTIRMECVAYGTLPLYYSWRREDGRPLVAGHVLSALNRVLTIVDAPLEADGNYICTCTRNTGATAAKVIVISMEAIPYFPYPIQNMFTDAGMTITWNCKAVARPAPIYSWYKNGVLLQNSPGYIEIVRNVLTILTVDKDRDEGMYQCAATNQHGTIFSTGQLKVLSFVPNFRRYPMQEIMLAPLNGNITIPCGVEGAPTPVVEWLKNGASLNLVPGDLNGRTGMNLAFGLVLTDINYSDQADYTCKASNELGEASDATGLLVMEGIVITQPPSDVVVQVNRTAFLFCQAQFGYNYDLTYVWKFNGKELDYDLSPEYVNGQRNGLAGLYITSAQRKNSGMYECVARTTLQSLSRSAFLEVKGPPGAPAGLYPDTESITTRSVRLIWTVTTYINNGGAITSYDIEGETNYHPNVWTVIASDIPEYVTVTEAANNAKRTDQRAVTIQELIPNTSYRFRVRAINTFGRGNEASRQSTYVKIAQTAPIIAPKGVSGGGGKVGTLVITWDILEPAEHCGPHLYYYVYWRIKPDEANNPTKDEEKDWKREKANDDLALDEGRYVVTVGTENFYLQYQVKVGAVNDNGAGPNSTQQVIFSAEGMPNSVPVSQDLMTYNTTSIIAYWEPVPDTRAFMKGRVAGYRIYYYANLNDEDPFSKEPDPVLNRVLWKDVYGQTDHAQLIGLIQNAEYFARVQVFNGAGFGPKGEWRRSETANDPIKDHPVHVAVYQRDTHSVFVTWREVTQYPGEESLEGYILRVWKIQADIRTAEDTVVDKVNEAVIEGLQQNAVYVLRILGYSKAGDGGLSEAVYFAIALRFIYPRHRRTIIASAIIGGGRPRVTLRAAFQARTGTRVEPQTFRKPAGQFPNMKVLAQNGRGLNIPIDPTTSEICYSDEYTRTCGSESVFGHTLNAVIVTVVSLVVSCVIR